MDANMILWDALLKHRGHNVSITSYGDTDNPIGVCLECEDCGEVILDESVRYQKLDLFSVTLRQIGAYIARLRLEDAVDVIVNGDCDSQAAEVASLSGADFGYNTMLDFWTQLDPYEMNTILAANDVALDLLKMPELQGSPSGFGFQHPCCITMPFGSTLIRSSAVPKNTVIGIDKRFALEMVQIGDVEVEYDKLIDRQFERTAITAIGGFSKIYDEASRILSIKA